MAWMAWLIHPHQRGTYTLSWSSEYKAPEFDLRHALRVDSPPTAVDRWEHSPLLVFGRST